ncbi:MAG TPA: PKD domain-containing protein [Methanocella sp.]
MDSGTYNEKVTVNKQLTILGNDTGTGNPVIDGQGSGTVMQLFAPGIHVYHIDVKNSGSGSNGFQIAASDCIIGYCNATACDYGFYANSVSNITLIADKACNDPSYGFDFWYVTWLNMTNCEAGNDGNGLVLWYCNGGSSVNTISGLNSSYNNNGVYLYPTSNTVINGSYIAYNRNDGIRMDFSSRGNVVSWSNITNNYWNIDLLNGATGNVFFRNNVGSPIHGNVYDGTGGNKWNSTAPMDYRYNDVAFTNYNGNYWGGYAGYDNNDDGIGDTSYLAGNLVDYYPLVYTSLHMPVPVANFFADITVGVAPLTVQFNDTTSNKPTSWQWNFGDGTDNSTVQSPVHTFSSYGTYTVTLTVANDGGSSTRQIENYIIVNDRTLPVTTISVFGDLQNGQYHGDACVLLSATDNAGGSGVNRTEYSYDGASWNIYTDPFNVSAIGSTTIYYRSVDNAGNIEATGIRVIVIANPDTIAPATTYRLDGTAGSNGWYRSSVQITLSASDNMGGSGIARTLYRIGATGPWTTYVSPLAISAEGTTTLYYYSTDNAENAEPAGSVDVKIDTTAPTVTGTCTTQPNENGWYNADVTVHFAASDMLSGLASTTPDTVISTEGADNAITGTATDAAGNMASFTVSGIKIDRTAPAIAGTRLTDPNSRGWNNGDVTVCFLASDGLSGLKTPAVENVVITAEGSNQQATRTAEDLAGNTATATVGSINIDRTDPVLTCYRTPANQYGWNNGPVTVSFSARDDLSGIDAYSEYPMEFTCEGTNMGVAGSARDRAGNAVNLQVNGINIDFTPPMITGAATTAPNANGWYNTDVTVSFTATDGRSGVDTITPDVILSTEGTDNQAAGTATDKAGNSASVIIDGIKIDKTAPTITGRAMTGPNANGWYNSDVIVSFSATDALSGLESTTPDILLSTEGANNAATGTATDKADNSASFTVAGVRIDKTAPALGPITMPQAFINKPAAAEAIINADLSGIAGASWGWGDGSSSVAAIGGDIASGVHTYASAGAYTVTLTATDVAGNTAVKTCAVTVTGSSTIGSVKADGWFDSPADASVTKPAATGKAKFKINLEYRSGATAPTGKVEFSLKEAGIDFVATAYDWLAIDGANATISGSGELNGITGYRFCVSCVDGSLLGKKVSDRYRITIWGPNGVLYDNEKGSPDTAWPITMTGGGRIAVEKGTDKDKK